MRRGTACLMAALLITVSLLGGCANKTDDKEQSESNTASSTQSQSMTTSSGPFCVGGEPLPCEVKENTTSPHRVEFIECTTYFLTVLLDPQKLNDRLPEGYSVSSAPNSGLDSLMCRSAVVDNVTVYNDVRAYTIGRPVEVPAEVHDDAATDIYLFEYCINTPAILDLLAAAGLAMCNGTVLADLSGPQVQVSFYQDNALVYQFNGAGEADNATSGFQERLRLHHATPQLRGWYDEQRDPETPGDPGEAGLVDIRGGLLGQLLLVPGESTFANGGIGVTKLVMEIPIEGMVVTA